MTLKMTPPLPPQEGYYEVSAVVSVLTEFPLLTNLTGEGPRAAALAGACRAPRTPSPALRRACS